MEHNDQRREYRRPAAPEVVATVPDAANGYLPSGQDFGFYAYSSAPS
jgi:hypothetical protein